MKLNPIIKFWLFSIGQRLREGGWGVVGVGDGGIHWILFLKLRIQYFHWPLVTSEQFFVNSTHVIDLYSHNGSVNERKGNELK